MADLCLHCLDAIAEYTVYSLTYDDTFWMCFACAEDKMYADYYLAARKGLTSLHYFSTMSIKKYVVNPRDFFRDLPAASSAAGPERLCATPHDGDDVHQEHVHGE